MAKLPNAPKIIRKLETLTEDIQGEISSDNDKEDVESSGIIEQDDYYFVKVNIAGFSKDEIDIEIDGNTLRVIAQRKEERQTDGSYSFSAKSKRKAVRIPQNADVDTATAKYKDGILLVRFTKINGNQSSLSVNDNVS